MSSNKKASRSELLKQVKSADTALSSASEVNAFLQAAKNSNLTKRNAKLIFALDATMSRQETWDMACHIQSEMFQEASRFSEFEVKLAYFRGFNECRSSKWVKDPRHLAGFMRKISCQGGKTQIRKILSLALQEAEKQKVPALVYIGDAMEENIDTLCDKAGQLGLIGVPVFLFQEGQDLNASRSFSEIARLTKGAHCTFDQGAASQLADLLKAVAAYAGGGKKALLSLEKEGGKGATLLLSQLSGE